MRAVSLFSGCGGMDWGFQAAGFEVVRAVDNDRAAVRVHTDNMGDSALCQDVRNIDFSEWRRELGSVELVLGGFPCQGFSKAGPKRKDDPRNLLYESMRDAVRSLEPDYFVAENVEGLAQNFGGEALGRIAHDFEALGYEVSVRLIDANSFGLPQHRRRIFFVGRRHGISDLPFSWPLPTHVVRVRNGETNEPKALGEALHGLGDMRSALATPLTIRDGIGDLICLSAPVSDHQVISDFPPQYAHVIRAIGTGQKLCNVRNGPESVRTWDIPEAFGETTAEERKILETIARNRRHKRYGRIPNGNPLPEDEIERLTGFSDLGNTLKSLEERGFLKRKLSGYDLQGALFCSGLFKRPEWDAPSPTVLTNFGNPRYFVHPIEDRPFSLREAARLQGFPDDFEFLRSGVSLIDGYRLVGNAVPPPLARALAEAVLRDATCSELKTA